MLKKILPVIIALCVLMIPGLNARAEFSVPYTDPNTGYAVILDDGADLLTPAEEKSLTEAMKPLAAYGHVMFVSIDYNPRSSTYNYAADYIYNTVGNDSVTMFIIDMDERYLYLLTNGRARELLNDQKCNSITDNVYKYASGGNYGTCAEKAFTQALTLLEGGRISEPMRYVTSAILALLAALFINFIIVYLSSRVHKTSDHDLLAVAEQKFVMDDPSVALLGTTKRYSPQSKSSGSGGGGGRSGGGGFSGGGGGHRF